MVEANATPTLTAAHVSADTILSSDLIAVRELARVVERKEMAKTQPKVLDCS